MELKVFEQINDRYDIQGVGKGFYDIVYDTKSEKNKLDLYLPLVKRDKYPLLVFIHSGGFFKSDKGRHLSNILNGLLFGYAVASVNYRLNDEARYSDSREDTINALNYLAEMKNIDETKIILWGESYGSYLALDIEVNHTEHLNFIPAGIIDMYCVTDLYDFHQYKIANNQQLIVRGKENDYHTFGDDLKNAMDETKFINNITGKEPPIFIIHGMKDGFIPIKYSYALEEELKKKGVTYEAHYIEEGIHGIDYYNIPKYNSLVFEFINQQLCK